MDLKLNLTAEEKMVFKNLLKVSTDEELINQLLDLGKTEVMKYLLLSLESNVQKFIDREIDIKLKWENFLDNKKDIEENRSIKKETPETEIEVLDFDNQEPIEVDEEAGVSENFDSYFSE